jgi:diguanylate cyclase (GGDEF)-like protein
MPEFLRKIDILLVEDDPGEAELLKRSILSNFKGETELKTIGSLAEAQTTLRRKSFHIILLDLHLPDARGFEGTFLTLQDEFPTIPIILITSLDDEELAVQALRSGAQDFILKGTLNNEQTVRSIRFAIERHQLLMETMNQSLLDELTGVYNRRGFQRIARDQIKLSKRNKRELILVYLDLDGMKDINDAFGHGSGDTALKRTAEILKESFRETDVIGRMGGDEFCVLALGTTPEYSGIIATRLIHNMEKFNRDPASKFVLSFSLGISNFNPDNPLTLEEMINRADQAMYLDKRSHKNWKH